MYAKFTDFNKRPGAVACDTLAFKNPRAVSKIISVRGINKELAHGNASIYI